MPTSFAVLALALAAAPPPVTPARADAHAAAATSPPSQPAPSAAPSRSAFGAAIAEMTRTLQAEAAAKRVAPGAPDTSPARTAAVDRDE